MAMYGNGVTTGMLPVLEMMRFLILQVRVLDQKRVFVEERGILSHRICERETDDLLMIIIELPRAEFWEYVW